MASASKPRPPHYLYRFRKFIHLFNRLNIPNSPTVEFQDGPHVDFSSPQDPEQEREEHRSPEHQRRVVHALRRYVRAIRPKAPEKPDQGVCLRYNRYGYAPSF